jgi:hypothetical protein
MNRCRRSSCDDCCNVCTTPCYSAPCAAPGCGTPHHHPHPGHPHHGGKAEPIPAPKDGGKPLPKGDGTKPGVDKPNVDKPSAGKPQGGDVRGTPQPVNTPALEVAPRSAPNPF